MINDINILENNLSKAKDPDNRVKLMQTELASKKEELDGLYEAKINGILIRSKAIHIENNEKK